MSNIEYDDNDYDKQNDYDKYEKKQINLHNLSVVYLLFEYGISDDSPLNGNFMDACIKEIKIIINCILNGKINDKVSADELSPEQLTTIFKNKISIKNFDKITMNINNDNIDISKYKSLNLCEKYTKFRENFRKLPINTYPNKNSINIPNTDGINIFDCIFGEYTYKKQLKFKNALNKYSKVQDIFLETIHKVNSYTYHIHKSIIDDIDNYNLEHLNIKKYIPEINILKKILNEEKSLYLYYGWYKHATTIIIEKIDTNNYKFIFINAGMHSRFQGPIYKDDKIRGILIYENISDLEMEIIIEELNMFVIFSNHTEKFMNAKSVSYIFYSNIIGYLNNLDSVKKQYQQTTRQH